jgi:hypothetical protein
MDEELKKYFEKRLEHAEKRVEQFNDVNVEELSQSDRAMFEKGLDIGYWKGRVSALYDILDYLDEKDYIEFSKGIE